MRASFAPALAALVEAAYAAGEPSEARGAAERVLAAGGQLPPGARVAYGEALLQEARGLAPKAAVALVRAALHADPARVPPYEAEARRMLCKGYAQAGSSEAALAACQRAVDAAPHEHDSRERLAWARQRTAELQRDRHARARMRREAAARERREAEAKRKAEENEWQWQSGDGEWHKGRGGGKGNKRGGGAPRKVPAAPRGLYDALGLAPSCARADIKKAYHRHNPPGTNWTRRVPHPVLIGRAGGGGAGLPQVSHSPASPVPLVPRPATAGAVAGAVA